MNISCGRHPWLHSIGGVFSLALRSRRLLSINYFYSGSINIIESTAPVRQKTPVACEPTKPEDKAYALCDSLWLEELANLVARLI